MKVDWFLIGLLAAASLAFAFPDPGAPGGILHPELLTKGGVALIFFLHGVALSFENLKAGVMRWPVHLLVQLSTFVLFPLVGLAFFAGLQPFLPEDLRVGIFFLTALPSTVSSSVALTAAARGNVPAAVFNATLSSLIGIFITPFLVALIMKTEGISFPLGPVILDLCFWLALPFALGQASRPVLAGWAKRNKNITSKVDRLTILLLVYTSFCDSVKRGIWQQHSSEVIIAALVVSFVLFWIIFWVMKWATKLLGFGEEDRITTIFCGSKKTLASGVPMAALIFEGNPGIGMILVPLMIYHAMQLIICGWLAGRWAKRSS